MIDVTTWKGLGLNICRVLLAINVKESDDGFPFMCGSNALPDAMVGKEVLSLVQSMSGNG